MPNLSSEAWERLASYESSDVVSRLYAEVHGRPPADGKAREMTSMLSQAREYYVSAAQASDLVRPLLLYYGVLGLARWLILFRVRIAREATLAQQHGLVAHHWHEPLTNGIAGFAQTSTRVTKGTFSELVAATRGSQEVRVFNQDGVRSLHWFQGVTPVPVSEATMTPRDVLARISEVALNYGECFDDTTRCRSVHIDGMENGVRITVQRLPAEDDSWIRHAFQLPDDAVVGPVERSAYGYPFFWELILPTARLNDLPPRLPPLSPEGGYLVTYDPLPNGPALTKLSLLFAISFMAGMLVRYHPRQWLAFLNHENGDTAYPALQTAISAVEVDFPKRVYESAAAMISEPGTTVIPAVGTQPG